MYSPALKKRKLNTSATLTKPFKSPLRTAPLVQETPDSSSALDVVTTAGAPRLSSSQDEKHPSSKQSPSSLLSSPLKSSPDLQKLQRQNASLQRRLKALFSELDTVNQASKIKSSGKDAELDNLISTWRSVSQEAAEEVFTTVRDRVNRMGGVRAWKERERDKIETRARWDEETREAEQEALRAAEEDSDGNSGDEGVREDHDEELHRWSKTEIRAERERRAAELEESVESYEAENPRTESMKVIEETADEEEGYTMDMMLRSLNIDLNMIGYDRALQRWAD